MTVRFNVEYKLQRIVCILIILCGVTVWAFFAGSDRTRGGAEARRSPAITPLQTHDLGDLLPAEVGRYVFNVHNTTSNNVVVDRIVKTCGCAEASVERSTIPPDGYIRLSTALGPLDELGPKSAGVFLYCHSLRQQMLYEFRLIASVGEVLSLPENEDPSCCHLGTWSLDQLPHVVRTTLIRGTYPLSFDQIEVACDAPEVFPVITPIDKRRWLLAITVTPHGVFGGLGSVLKFHFADHGRTLPQSQTLQAFVNVSGPVSASPSSLLFVLSPGQKVQKVLQLNSHGGESTAAEVTGVAVSSPNVAVAVNSDSSRKFVVVTYTAPTERLRAERGQVVLSIVSMRRAFKLRVNFLALSS